MVYSARMNAKRLTPIKRAADLAGGPIKLAEIIGAQPKTVRAWVYRGRCPARFAIAVELACDGRVTRYQLRPDTFGAA